MRNFPPWPIRMLPASSLMRSVFLIAVAVLFLVIYLHRIGSNPAGFFCDEAQIGVEAYRFLRGEAHLQPIPLFVRNFQYTHLGVLPMLVTAPFVALFGMDDASVRLTAAVLMLATLATLYMTLRRLEISFPMVAVALFGLSPAVIHVGRINLGHAPSLLLLAVGFDLFVRARTRRSVALGIAAGICFGLSAYSNGPFYVFSPMVVAAIGIGEACFNGGSFRSWTIYGWTSGVTALLLSPFVYEILTNPEFLRRLTDKQLSHNPLLSIPHLLEMAANYPKYFSLDYLFLRGEAGLPGGWNLRHSVPGAGELNWMVLPMLALALLGLVRCWRHPAMRFLVPWVVIAVIYPLPDLLTTGSAQPPYTFALVGATLAIPFLGGLALIGLERLTVSRPRIMTAAASLMLAGTVIVGLRFYAGPYQAYPMISAGYYGWQYGPREMIGYYKAHAAAYDEFFMDGNYNAANAFLDFYILDEEQRRKAVIGDLSQWDLAKRQLFAVRAEIWEGRYEAGWPAKESLRILATIPYPNGEPAAYLVEPARQ